MDLNQIQILINETNIIFELRYTKTDSSRIQLMANLIDVIRSEPIPIQTHKF